MPDTNQNLSQQPAATSNNTNSQPIDFTYPVINDVSASPISTPPVSTPPSQLAIPPVAPLRSPIAEPPKNVVPQVENIGVPLTAPAVAPFNPVNIAPTPASPVADKASHPVTPITSSTDDKKARNNSPIKSFADKFSEFTNSLVEKVADEDGASVAKPSPSNLKVEKKEASVSAQSKPAQSSPVVEFKPTSVSNSAPKATVNVPVGSTKTDILPQSSEPMVAPVVKSVQAPALTSMPAPIVPKNQISSNMQPTIPTPMASPVVPVSSGTYPFSIHQLLDMVVARNASDLHLAVGYPAMIRIDGELISVSTEIIDEKIVKDLIYPVLTEQKKELLEVNREVDLAYAHKNAARFRINAFFQQQSMAAAFRLIPNKIRTIDELNLPPIYHQLSKLGQGLVLVTGPTGHGKSTTLAAIIQEINMTRSAHVITIEDPVEYVFPRVKAMIDQREMHEDTHSWEIALKSALRQDPDVILVGEMRDYETIASAITLAETGHLVFATLHTNSAAQTIDRIIDVFPENQQPQVRSQLSNIIESVVAQRLIPLNGGGRRAVSEIMIANAAVRNLIREGKTHQIDNVIGTSSDIGMISLEHSLVELVREGLITVDRAQEYAVHPEEVVRLLK